MLLLCNLVLAVADSDLQIGNLPLGGVVSAVQPVYFEEKVYDGQEQNGVPRFPGIDTAIITSALFHLFNYIPLYFILLKLPMRLPLAV